MSDEHRQPVSAESALLTVPETAKRLRLTASTIRAWIFQRRLPFIKLGSRVFLRQADVDRLIESSVIPARSKTKEQKAA